MSNGRYFKEYQSECFRLLSLVQETEKEAGISETQASFFGQANESTHLRKHYFSVHDAELRKKLIERYSQFEFYKKHNESGARLRDMEYELRDLELTPITTVVIAVLIGYLFVDVGWDIAQVHGALIGAVAVLLAGNYIITNYARIVHYDVIKNVQRDIEMYKKDQEHEIINFRPTFSKREQRSGRNDDDGVNL